VCLFIHLIVARQRLGKKTPAVAGQPFSRNFTAVTNIHATIEELLDASFSMCLVSYTLENNNKMMMLMKMSSYGKNKSLIFLCHDTYRIEHDRLSSLPQLRLTKPLPSNDKRIHIDTQTDGRCL
jgi:hypothetical protein